MIDKIILGTVQLGLNYGINNKNGQPTKLDSYKILDFAKKEGIKTIDTADAYGTASDLIGEYNKLNPNVFKVNTKFKINEFNIKDQLISSLNKLHSNKIDTYFFHSYADFIRFPESLNELDQLKEIDLINKIGISVYDNEEFLNAINCTKIDTIQIPYNLLDNYSQRGQLLELAKSKKKTIQVRSIYLQGLFFMKTKELPEKLKPLSKHMERLNDIAETTKMNINNMALQYAINQPLIDSVIFGVDNVQQLKENLKSIKETTNFSFIEEINQIKVEETELLYPKNW